MKILHCFADKGAENPCLDRYGDVYHFSIDIEPNKYSEAVQADVRNLPIQEDVTFDIGFFHPPCAGVSPMTDVNGDRNEWPDLIPEAREAAQTYCDDWVIENKPRESLDAEVVLDGHMFGLGIEYKRGFETSFPVEQPPQQSTLAETSPFFYTEKPIEWWASVKGTSTEFTHQHIAKNTIPSAYIDYLMKHYSLYADSDPDRSDYSGYRKEMETRQAEATNTQLTQYE